MAGDMHNYDALARAFVTECVGNIARVGAIAVRYREMQINGDWFRNAVQEVMDAREYTADRWYWINRAVQIACGLALTIPVNKHGWTPQTGAAGAAFGPITGDERTCPERPGGPLEAQYHLLSDRVAHIHAFVLSAR
jgi:hypothetical protein